MTRFVFSGSRPFWHWAILALLFVLAAGCGRKGPLFLPQQKLQEAEEALQRQDPTTKPPAQTAPTEQTAPNQTSQPPR